MRSALVFDTAGLASLGSAEGLKCATPSPFIVMEVGLGALAATLAAEAKGKSVDFPLLVEILKSHGVLTAEDLALITL